MKKDAFALLKAGVGFEFESSRHCALHSTSEMRCTHQGVNNSESVASVLKAMVQGQRSSLISQVQNIRINALVEWRTYSHQRRQASTKSNAK